MHDRQETGPRRTTPAEESALAAPEDEPIRRAARAALLTLALSALASAATAQLTFSGPLEPGFNPAHYSGEYLRELLVAIPRGYDPAAAEPRPLLLAFHGTGGRIEEYASGELANLVDYATRLGWLVVLPQGLPEDPTLGTGKIRWNTTYPHPKLHDPLAPDDLEFVKGVIGDLDRVLPIDGKRIYAVGFSGGGTFAQLLAATEPRTVAAVVASGSSRGTFSVQVTPAGRQSLLIELPSPERAVPAMLLHGSKEEELETKRPYAGGLSDGASELGGHSDLHRLGSGGALASRGSLSPAAVDGDPPALRRARPARVGPVPHPCRALHRLSRPWPSR